MSNSEYGVEKFYSLRATFKKDVYQSQWQKDMHKMFDFGNQLTKHRRDLLHYQILRDDGSVVFDSHHCN